MARTSNDRPVRGERRAARRTARQERSRRSEATPRRKALRLATAGATLGLVAALTLVGTGLSDGDGTPVESVADRPALPLGSPTPGYGGAEATALELATEFSAVDMAPGRPCPEDDLAVSWDDPGDGYETGSHYAPVGPRPEGNGSANGIVFCEGFDFDYTGFSISWDGTRWEADLAPDFGDGEEDPDHAAGDPDDPDGPLDPTDPTQPIDPDDAELPEAPELPALPAPSGPTDLVDQLDSTLDEIGGVTDLELTRPWQGLFDEFAIEDLAAYEPQATCDPAPKAGTVGFSELLLDTFASTGSSGIARSCDVGGRSEHKEGRAFDWSALVDDPRDARAASQVIGWLLATDEHGEPYAMARRLGVMYIIYNQSIWRSYAPEQGWVGYTGPNPHIDHVHFSFDRAGGAGATSFWEVADLPDVSALDFGPYALLPDAGGVSADGDQPAVLFGGLDPDRPGNGGGNGGNGGNGPDLPDLPGGDGGGDGGTDTPSLPGTPGTPDTPDVPNLPGLPGLPQVPTPTLPPVTIPPLPPVTVPPLPGGGGLLPSCPPGTPLIPPPLHCLLPGRSRP